MKTIALLSNNVLVNIAVWDGVSAWDPVAAGMCDSTVDISNLGSTPAIGATYSNGTFTAPAPPSALPDPNSFGAAVLADSSISMATRLLVANWIPGLLLALQAANVPLISSTWADLISQYSISTGDQSAVEALATQFAIPGL